MTFAALALATLIAPWLFGAWEMWWFWPFAAAISAGAVFTGLQLLLKSKSSPVVQLTPGLRNTLLALLPFLAYAAFRWTTSEVFMSAERSVLLFFSAAAIAVEIIFGLDSRRRRLLFGLIFVNLALQGLYGIINETVWKTKYVMWAAPYPQYAGRASGSYYCPDHYAGLMEILLSMSLAMLLTRSLPGRTRLAACVSIPVALTGILLSLSRGSLLTLPVIFGAAVIWGVAQWPREIRGNLRIIAVASALLALIVAAPLADKMLHRFKNYGGKWGHHWRNNPALATDGEEQEISFAGSVIEGLKRTCRGRMYGGAWRAWQSAPRFGIGAGMHQNLWPHFAPTADGNRELGIWPSLPNDHLHSYEVHSDWLQLLEEYGAIGLALFLIAFGAVLLQLLHNIRREQLSRCNAPEGDAHPPQSFVFTLAAMLALAGLAFHSFGDFNLQIPATVWILAAVLAIGLAEAGASG